MKVDTGNDSSSPVNRIRGVSNNEEYEELLPVVADKDHLGNIKLAEQLGHVVCN
jgi:hypothetical protein